MIILNLLLFIVAGIGIYNFSHSYLWAIIGSILINSGFFGASRKPNFVGFLAYPLVEYVFNGSLTIYSGIYCGIVILEVICLYIIIKSYQYHQ